MKYFYFILLTLLVSIFFIFSNLNSDLIELDLYFLSLEGISIGFAIVFSIFLGALISVFLQIPKLFKRTSKAKIAKVNENS